MNIDVSVKTGFPAWLELTEQKLEFGGRLKQTTPDLRRLGDAKQVFRKPESLEAGTVLYKMYRGVGTEEDTGLFAHHNLRYDLTLIPALIVGDEHNKTVGHYHPEKTPGGLTYPEVYEVLHGKAHYLLQKASFSKSPSEIEKSVLIEALPGEKVLIPPGYGHITINPGECEPLLMANVTADGFASVYEPIQKTGGGSYFELLGGKIEKNEKYTEKGKLVKAVPIQDRTLGLEAGQPLYLSLKQDPRKFRYLTHPEDFMSLWDGIEKEWE